MKSQSTCTEARVHYRTGSLEISGRYEVLLWFVHYRTGSLESYRSHLNPSKCVHYRTGSLEI